MLLQAIHLHAFGQFDDFRLIQPPERETIRCRAPGKLKTYEGNLIVIQLIECLGRAPVSQRGQMLS